MPLTLKNEQSSLALPQPKKKIQESFENFKDKQFNKNYTSLFSLTKHYPDKFLDCELKKQEGRLVTLWLGGTKLITLFNHELIFHVRSELVDWVKEQMEKPL